MSKLDPAAVSKVRNLVASDVGAELALASAWREALACEARNSLQVILSGAEILLEDHWANLQTEQKALLSKMMDNAYHLCNLTGSLLASNGIRTESIGNNAIAQLRRAGTKIALAE
jgi:hypothetical protein